MVFCAVFQGSNSGVWFFWGSFSGGCFWGVVFGELFSGASFFRGYLLVSVFLCGVWTVSPLVGLFFFCMIQSMVLFLMTETRDENNESIQKPHILALPL